jgi:hypothetical protein
MALTVVTPSAQPYLTTAQTVLEQLGLSGAKVEWLIKAATHAAERFTGRIFARQTYDETVAGYGDALIELTNTPVVSITSVTSRGTVVTDYILENAQAGWLYRAAAWGTTERRRATFGTNWATPEGFADPLTTVRYVGGYLMPGQTGRDLPYDLEQFALLCVQEWYGSLTRDATVSSISLGGDSISYSSGGESTALGLSNRAIGLLMPWRRFV